MKAQEVLDIIEHFDKVFKFKINQPVRHKADKKEYGMNDVGLLVLERYLIQSTGDNSLIFKRRYLCRMIKFSGSGDLLLFNEHELQSIEDWRRDAINDEYERNLLREGTKQLEEDILKQFGITKTDRFRLKNEDGSVDESIEYRMCGFRSENGKYELIVRQSNTLVSNVESVHVSDKNSIIKIPLPL